LSLVSHICSISYKSHHCGWISLESPYYLEGRKEAQAFIILKLKKVKGTFLPLWTFLTGNPSVLGTLEEGKGGIQDIGKSLEQEGLVFWRKKMTRIENFIK